MSRKSGAREAAALAELPSLGQTSAAALVAVGIDSVEALRMHGAIASYRALRARFGKRITGNWIYALECAIQGIDWRLLPRQRKDELRAAAQCVARELDAL